MRLPARLLKRPLNSHKGDFGHVLILAGSFKYIGAPLLCAKAALRSGAGLVTLGIPKGLYDIFAKRVEELMLLGLSQTNKKTLAIKAYAEIADLTDKIDCLVIGPGLSNHASTLSLVRKIVKYWPKPIVIDADGLNALVKRLDLLKYSKAVKVLTPHEGEMSRLLNRNRPMLNNERKSIAKTLASKYNVVVALKGHNTVISDGKSLYINTTGNPGMATAGSGDVLAGIIGSFIAQGLKAFEAARYAVYIHGLAGDIAAENKTEIGLIASDIVESIPEAIRKAS